MSPSLREGTIKKTVFFGENPKGGGGGLAESKISVNRKKLRIFWIFCQKGGGLTQSKISVNRKNLAIQIDRETIGLHVEIAQLYILVT